MSVRLRVLWLVPGFLAVVAVAHPGLVRAAGVDFWTVGEARAELAEAAATDRALDERHDAILRRIAIKEALITDLIAGRLSLAEVAARFLELNEDEPGYLVVLRSAVPGDSDLERSARNVIDYVGERVPDPAHRADFRRRLEADLTRLQDAHYPAVP
ncbi:hypothetical protein J0H58_30390 [bacterium]|nr:hypothetical protein [bacterium]